MKKTIIITIIFLVLVISLISLFKLKGSDKIADNNDASMAGEQIEGDFSPTSGIIFTSDFATYYMDENGGNIRRLSSEGGQNDRHPAVSFDGTKIAFDNDTQGIVIMNMDGTGRTVLVDDSEGSSHFPAWSPDGKKIYYTKQTKSGGNTLIFSVNTDGTGNETRVSPSYGGKNDIGELSPRVSPDGTKIAFNTERPFYVTSPQGKSVQISGNFGIMNTDGSGMVPFETVKLEDLLGDPDFDAFETWYTWLTVNINQGVSWSPDGNKIAFSAYPPASKKFHAYPPDKSPRLPQIYVINKDGTELIQLTSDTTANSYGPSWSPDGTKIIFWKEYPGSEGNKIYVMNSDGSSQTALKIEKINSDTNFTGHEPEWPSFFQRAK